jgi:hypothetical protein
MLSKIKQLVAISLPALLVACAAAPTDEQRANANYGTPMSQGDCETLIKSSIELTLKDPSSAQYRSISQCSRAIDHLIIVGGNAYVAAYRVDLQVNAKNSFGGYVGFTPYAAVMRNGEILQLVSGKCSYVHFRPNRYCDGAYEALTEVYALSASQLKATSKDSGFIK